MTKARKGAAHAVIVIPATHHTTVTGTPNDPEFERSTCLLCGASSPIAVAEHGQFHLPTHVVVCERCGFSYLDPRWSKERYAAFYVHEYDTLYRPEIAAQDDLRTRFVPVKQIIERLKERQLLREPERVLDLGSGMGHALTYLRENQWPNSRYEAIEPSSECIKHLRTNGIELVASDVYSNWEESREGRYDLIIMRHVLEHFHDPLSVLRKVRQALAKDGLLYLAVPDALHPTKPLHGHFFRVVHISYFSKHSLRSMCEAAGLAIESIHEGDQHARNEVFTFCRPGLVRDLVPDSSLAKIQVQVYRRMGRPDPLFATRRALARMARKLGVIQ